MVVVEIEETQKDSPGESLQVSRELADYYNNLKETTLPMYVNVIRKRLGQDFEGTSDEDDNFEEV